MKSKGVYAIFVSLILIMLLQMTALADSSWHWITTSPLPILPFAIVLTIAIETFVIAKFDSIKKRFKVFCVVCISNVFSFLAPYVWLKYQDIAGERVYTFDEVFNKGPSYIITFRYLVITLIVEIPIVYFFLRKDVADKKRLIFVIAIANIITTILIAIIERIICKGSW